MPKKLKQRDVAMRLLNRSARLLRLIDVDAPQVIIESERKLIADALAMWPVADKEDADKKGGA